jgi:hypothetical protein
MKSILYLAALAAGFYLVGEGYRLIGAFPVGPIVFLAGFVFFVMLAGFDGFIFKF